MAVSTQTAGAAGIDGFFKISERGSTVGREVRGGIVTFFTMAYIVVLNPLILGFAADVDGVRTVEVGTLAWLIGFVALLPFYGRLDDAGRTWWLWTCLAGFGLGLFGIEYCRRRRRARAELTEPDA